MQFKLKEQTNPELDKLLGSHAFFTPTHLKAMGIFGTIESVRIAMRKGRLPFIKISQRRKVVPRHLLVQFIHENGSWINPKSNDKPNLRVVKLPKESP